MDQPAPKLVLVVMAADGTTKRWNFEGGGVRRLSGRGFVQDAIVLGQKLIVSYNPMRDGSSGGFFVGVRTADGKSYGTMRADAIAAAAVAFGVLWLAPPVSAHHSFAAFDRSTFRTVEGVVKDYDWANPHVKLTLAVRGSDGATTDWTFEGGSIASLVNAGFNRVSAAPGDRITVSYHPKRSGAGGGFFLSITNSNGRTYGPIIAR
jgi:hypothetical protein